MCPAGTHSNRPALEDSELTIRKMLVMFVAIGVAAQAAVVYGPSGSGGYNAYEIIYGNKTWDEARVDAYNRSFPGGYAIPANPSLYGHLATLTNQLENDFVAGAVGSGDRWIGLTDSDQTSTLDGTTMPGTEAGTSRTTGWAWVNGEPFSYEHFGGGEPNDSGGEDAAHVRGDGWWNDHQAGSSLGQGDARFPHIVEWELNLANDPTPPAPLLGIGPMGGMGFLGIREVRNNGTLNSVGNAITSLQSGTGLIFDGTGATVNHNDPNSAGGGGYFGNAGKAPFLSNTGADDNDIAFIANGYLAIDTPGMYTFGFRGDDGSQLRILGASFLKRWGGGTAYGDNILFAGPTGDSNTAAATYLTKGVHPLEFIFFERGGGAYVELWAAQGDYSSFNSNFHLIGDVANGGLRLVPEPATLSLLALGGLALLRRRKRS